VLEIVLSGANATSDYQWVRAGEVGHSARIQLAVVGHQRRGVVRGVEGDETATGELFDHSPRVLFESVSTAARVERVGAADHVEICARERREHAQVVLTVILREK